MTTYVLPDRLRGKLNRPIGELVPGSEVDLGSLLRETIRRERPAKLVLVGDSVSRKATESGLLPDVMVIDNLEKRRKANAHAYPMRNVIKAKNKAGTIEQNARLAVERAIRGDGTVVEIDGEEDLLALVAVIAAPLGSLVVYGQPDEGVVLVRVSEKTKAEAEGILQQMDRVG